MTMARPRQGTVKAQLSPHLTGARVQGSGLCRTGIGAPYNDRTMLEVRVIGELDIRLDGITG